MQKIIKIMNLLIICAVLFTIFYYNKNHKLQKQDIKKSYNHPGAVYFPYSVFNSTKESDLLYETLNGDSINLIYFRDTRPEEYRIKFEKAYYDTDLRHSYNYMSMYSPKSEEIKCADGTQNCLIYFFMRYCAPSRAVMCIINPKTKEIMPVPHGTAEQLIQFLEKHKNW